MLGFAMMALAVLLRRLKARHELFRNDSWRRFTLWLLGTAGNAVVVIVGLVFVRILAAAAPAGETVRSPTFPIAFFSLLILVGDSSFAQPCPSTRVVFEMPFWLFYQ